MEGRGAAPVTGRPGSLWGERGRGGAARPLELVPWRGRVWPAGGAASRAAGGRGGAVLRAARPGDGPAAAAAPGPLWRRKAQTLAVTASAALSRVCPKSALPDF